MKIFYILVIVLLGFWVKCDEHTQNQTSLGNQSNYLSGSEFAKSIQFLPREERERAIYVEVIQGNTPAFNKTFVPVHITKDTVNIELMVSPDYLCVGNDSDYVYVPLTPITAQRIASQLNSSLPTARIVDAIFTQATVKLRPQPIPPSDSMITVGVFLQHQDSIMTQLASLEMTKGELVAGHKKDVILSNRIYHQLKKKVPKPVVIYGWHKPDGIPIQPVYNGHAETYVDYSHGIRLVRDRIVINGRKMSLQDVLKSPIWSHYLSDEGVIEKPFYTID
jgi:hypothetical protein